MPSRSVFRRPAGRTPTEPNPYVPDLRLYRRLGGAIWQKTWSDHDHPVSERDLNRSPLSLRQAQIPGWGRDVLLRSCAALAVKLARPVLDAAAELLRVLLIAAGVIVGVGAASLVGLIAWR